MEQAKWLKGKRIVLVKTECLWETPIRYKLTFGHIDMEGRYVGQYDTAAYIDTEGNRKIEPRFLDNEETIEAINKHLDKFTPTVMLWK